MIGDRAGIRAAPVLGLLAFGVGKSGLVNKDLVSGETELSVSESNDELREGTSALLEGEARSE